MITNLKIKNFKSHSDTSLNFANLTVLCGANGVGKSSVLQTLLLLRQTHTKNRLQKGLDLNGDLCDIGGSNDALYRRADTDIIRLELQTDSDSVPLFWEFNGRSNDNRTFLKGLDYQYTPQSAAEKISLFNTQFQYLSAARLAPQESYPADTYSVEEERQISAEKGKGELVAHFLDHYGKFSIQFDTLLHPTNPTNSSLRTQTTAWESEISAGVEVKVNKTSRGYELKYAFGEGANQEEFMPVNVGFGLSYTLPIIVAILAAPKDSLLIIENPEAHLHPHGQAKLIELICLAAEAGVQIVLETHSDHIINGVLVASQKQKINPEHISIYHFDMLGNKLTAIPIKVLENGRIDKQPKGFFDQLDKDLELLAGF